MNHLSPFLGKHVCAEMPSCMILMSLPVLAIAVLVGYMAGTSPGGISPPLVPGASPLAEVPPWPIFRIALGLNDMLRGAAEATTLPKIRVLDLATRGSSHRSHPHPHEKIMSLTLCRQCLSLVLRRRRSSSCTSPSSADSWTPAPPSGCSQKAMANLPRPTRARCSFAMPRAHSSLSLR
ncbi:MAG: Uncharacterised protein [Porticoccaceae bacterium UBA1117]|nr:MAG: Uncharacterised protein [Porticoccaceae bacterium UBA1117]